MGGQWRRWSVRAHMIEKLFSLKQNTVPLATSSLEKGMRT